MIEDELLLLVLLEFDREFDMKVEQCLEIRRWREADFPPWVELFSTQSARGGQAENPQFALRWYSAQNTLIFINKQ